MANPCVIIFKGKEYSFAEFASMLHDGLLDELVKSGEVDGSRLKTYKGDITPPTVQKTEEIEQIKVRSISKDTHTKGIFVDEKGNYFKSTTSLIRELGSKGIETKEGRRTDEYGLLKENQDLKHLPRVGSLESTDKGEMFGIEKLNPIEKGELTWDEYKQLESTLHELNRRGISYSDNATVMRRDNGDVVLIDLSNAWRNANSEKEDLGYKVDGLLSDNDRSRLLAERSAANNKKKIELLKRGREDKFQYLMTQRPPSIGTHPEGVIKDPIEVPYINDRKAWLIEYDRPLTDRELSNFELIRVPNVSEIGDIYKRPFGKSDIYLTVDNVASNVIRVSEYLNGDKETEDLSYRYFANRLKDGFIKVGISEDVTPAKEQIPLTQSQENLLESTEKPLAGVDNFMSDKDNAPKVENLISQIQKRASSKGGTLDQLDLKELFPNIPDSDLAEFTNDIPIKIVDSSFRSQGRPVHGTTGGKEGYDIVTKAETLPHELGHIAERKFGIGDNAMFDEWERLNKTEPFAAYDRITNEQITDGNEFIGKGDSSENFAEAYGNWLKGLSVSPKIDDFLNRFAKLSKKEIREGNTGIAPLKQEETPTTSPEEITATIEKKQGKVPPPPESGSNEVIEGGKQGKNKIGLRALDSTRLSDEIKTDIKNNGIDYAIRGKKVRDAEAKEITDLYNKEGQLDDLAEQVYDLDNNIFPDTRTTLNVHIAKKYIDQLNNTEDLAQRKSIRDKITRAVAFGKDRATLAGEIVEAQKDWKDILGDNPEYAVHEARYRRAKEQEAMFEGHKEEVEAGYKTLKDFLESEEVTKLIDEKVSEEVSKIGTKRFGSADKKKIDDFFEGLKVKTEGKLFDATIALPIAVYNTSVDIIHKSVLMGVDIANAIQAGVEHLDKWYKDKYEKGEIGSPDWRREDYKASLRDKLKPLTQSVKKVKVSAIPKAKYENLVDKMYAKMPMANKAQLRMLVKNALEELATTGELSKESFQNELAKALGKPSITEQQEMDLFNAGMALKNVKDKGKDVEKAFDEYEKEHAKTTPDKEKIRELRKKVSDTIKEATKAIHLAQKAQKKADEIFLDTPDAVDTFVTLIKGNLLTVKSLVVNTTSNIGAPLLRTPKNAVASSLDWMISGVAKAYEPIIKKIDPDKHPWLYRQANKLPGSQRTVDFLAYMRGTPEGVKRGIIKSGRQLVSGALPEDLYARDIVRGFHPIEAAIRLAKMTRGKEPTNVNKYIQAILEAGPWAYNAEFMFRMLNVGDKPFKEPHYIGRLEELASLKGLKGAAKDRFIATPDDVSEADARLTADIASWQNDNAITKWLRDIEAATKKDHGKSLQNAIYHSNVVRIIARLGLATNAPYVKTPTNIIKETFEYAVVPYSLVMAGESAFHGNRRQALDFLGKAVVGTVITSIATTLVANKLISPPPSKDDKEKAQQFDIDKPYMLNVSATQRYLNGEDPTWRQDDLKVSIKPYGIMSAILMSHVKAFSESDPKTVKDMGYIDKMWVVIPSTVSSSLDQSFLAGVSTGLTAFLKGGAEMDKYLVNTARALSSAVYPNNISTLSKTFYSNNFIRETKDISQQPESTQRQILNDFKDRMFMGKDLPAKVTIWGKRVLRTPDNRNKIAYNLFDVTMYEKQQDSTFGTKIWNLYKDYKWADKEDATKLLPSLPSASTEVGWDERKMTPAEVEEFQMKVGERRAIYAQHYVDSNQWDEDDLNDKGDKLYKLYSLARREVLAEMFSWDETQKAKPKEWKIVYDMGVIPLPSKSSKWHEHTFTTEDIAMYNRVAADLYAEIINKKQDELAGYSEEERNRRANIIWKECLERSKKAHVLQEK